MNMSVFKSNISLVRLLKPARKICTTCIINKDENYEDLFHPVSRAPEIPVYAKRENESVKTKKARLLYQSRKRGMSENDLLLSTFAKKYLEKFNEEQLHQYDCLINLPSNDWDIFYWACNAKPTPPEFQSEVMDLLKKHLKNENREARLKQPDLY